MRAVGLKYALVLEGTDLDASCFRLGWRVGDVVHRRLASSLFSGVVCARAVPLFSNSGRADRLFSLVAWQFFSGTAGHS